MIFLVIGLIAGFIIGWFSLIIYSTAKQYLHSCGIKTSTPWRKLINRIKGCN